MTEPAETSVPPGWGRRDLLLLILAAGYLLGHCLYGLSTWEEGIIPNGADRILRGELPYRDFYSYQPGRYLLAGLAYRIGGHHLAAVRLLFALVTAGGVCCLYRASLRLLPPRWALVPSLLYLMAPGCWYFRIFPLTLIAGLAVTLAAWDRRRSLPPLLQGLIWSGLLLFKLEIAGIAAPLLLWANLRRVDRRRRLLHLLGGSLPGLGITLFLVVQGPGLRFQIDYYLFQLLQGRSLWGAAWPTPEWATLIRAPDRFFEDLVSWWPALLYVLLALGALWRRGGEPRAFLVWFWGVATLGLVFWRSGFGNAIRILPPAVLLQTWLVTRFLAGPRRFHRLVGMLAYLPLLGFVLGISLWGDQLSGALAEVGKTHVPLDHPRGRIQASYPEGVLLESLVAAVEAETDPEEPILVVPVGALVHFLTGRPNPGYHEWFQPLTFQYASQEAEYVRCLREAPPALVVYRDIDLDEREERRFRHFAPLMERFIRDGYYIRERIGSWEIRVPRRGMLLDLATDWTGPGLIEIQGAVMAGSVSSRPAVAMDGPGRIRLRLEVPAGGARLSGMVVPLGGSTQTPTRIDWTGSSPHQRFEPISQRRFQWELGPGRGELQLGGTDVSWVELRIEG